MEIPHEHGQVAGHDEHHDSDVAHHFHDMEQQHESAKLGMWLFLMTEILLFGGLFAFYAIYRAWHPEMFVNGHTFLDWELGALNTVILLFSSLTIALAIREIQLDRARNSAILLWTTIACAGGFMVIKAIEYSHKFHKGLLPGEYFNNPEVMGTNPHIFFSIYFVMTGLHGLHVVCGALFIAWVAYRTMRGEFHSRYYVPVEMGGLYWHLVDLIWIFLFPLLYLVG